MADRPDLADFVDGAWRPVDRDEALWLEDPVTGERLEPMGVSTDAAVEAALAAADRVHREGTWARLDAEERAAALERIADEAAARAEAIAVAEAGATGIPLAMTGMLAFVVHAAFRLAAAQLRAGVLRRTFTRDDGGEVEALRIPWGPAACLAPWNATAPLAAHKVASALAAGAPVVLKPSELTPHGTTLLAEAVEAAGLPAGVVNLVHGGPAVGGRLVTDPRVRAVSFTGGLRGGRDIAAACAADLKPAQLELGGNNPMVVLDDADLDDAALGVQLLLTQLNGQWCRALGRLIVHESIADALLERVRERLAALRIGPPTAEGIDMGPIIHSTHLARLRSAIAALEERGGKAHAPTPLPDGGGSWLAPTIVTGVASEDALDEIFGPVATLHRFTSDAEAVALANAAPFGLEGYVFGGEEERALGVARQVRAGEVKVNGASVMSLHLMAPRPAWGLSGFAEEGTVETITFFAGNRVVGVEGMAPLAG
jgi:acyl-CoA reductase-like NAD-dependent aldehyde dehydrogenase